MKLYRKCTAIIGILLLLETSQAVGQQQVSKDNINPVNTQQPQESLFQLKDNVVKELENRLDERKFAQINELKEKDVSEVSLSQALQAAGFSKEEIDTVLNLIQEDKKLAEAVKVAAPVALAINKAEAAIKEQEELLEKTQIDEEKKKISKVIHEQRSQIRQDEQKLLQIMDGVDSGKTEQIAIELKAAGYESGDIQIISKHLLSQALFVKKIRTLSDMVKSIDAIKEEIRAAEEKRGKADSEEQKKNISKDLSELAERIEKTKNDFSVITTGIDKNTFFAKESNEVELDKELKEIFAPIIVELKKTTERPRKMEKIRSETVFLEKRLQQIRQASADIGKFLEKVDDKKVRDRLAESKDYWEQREKELVSQFEADKNQLFQLENERKSLLTSFNVFIDSFVKHRGKSLFFAVLAFVGIYLFFRLLQRIIWKISPIHKAPKYMFWANLVDVMFYVLTFLVATGALVAVLFTSGDWLILAVVLLLIIGIIWGARNTLPHLIEHIKLLLGFGTVRQGERVMIDNIPYRVEMMGVYSYLKNPALTGGTLRLPVKDLVGMRSRPYDERESWFPCKEGDYILIDGSDRSTWRKVKLQTPQEIVFEWFEMIEGMATSSFLNRRILNLSAAPFRVKASLFVSCKHRFEVLGVREKLNSFLAEELQKMSYKEHILGHDAAFIGFGDDSSLKFSIRIDAKPEAAAYYPDLSVDMTNIALAAANKYGWELLQTRPISIHHSEQARNLLDNSGEAVTESGAKF